MSRSFVSLLFIACCLGLNVVTAQTVPQPTPSAQPQYNPAQVQNPQLQLQPQLQQQLTPYQQQQLEQARQAQLQQRPAQPQYDPRFQPAQYQPPVNNAALGQAQTQPLQPGIAPNGQPGQPLAQPVQMQPARAPFQLTPQQEADLDITLRSWETTSSAVKTFQAEITRWEYDPVFGPQNSAKTEAAGVIRFQAPDKGLFEITAAKNFNMSSNKFEPSTDKSQLEHWVCDGTYVYVVDHKEKKMVKNELPPNMRGTQIADGPLPFVFGQKADKLKARYWVRVTTPPNIKDQLWLEAFPKYQADAANYKKVDIILDAKQLHPLAIQTHSPDPKSTARVVFQFNGQKANSVWDNTWIWNFIEPKVPSGYKLVEERYNDPASQPPPQKPLQAEVPGAQRK